MAAEVSEVSKAACIMYVAVLLSIPFCGCAAWPCSTPLNIFKPHVTILQERIARVHELEHIAIQLICQSKKLGRHFPSKNSNLLRIPALQSQMQAKTSYQIIPFWCDNLVWNAAVNTAAGLGKSLQKIDVKMAAE